MFSSIIWLSYAFTTRLLIRIRKNFILCTVSISSVYLSLVTLDSYLIISCIAT